ncbi:MAG: hypothetical protein KA144_14165 [Xanthomonadaceae bacterium]|nr:hypothetical protein [Xanthomonadaceae bacterium]
MLLLRFSAESAQVPSLLRYFADSIFLSRKAQKVECFQKERNQAYTELLRSLESLNLANSIENKKRFGFCAARVEILASDEVNIALHHFCKTDVETPARNDAFKVLLIAMRSDLVNAG